MPALRLVAAVPGVGQFVVLAFADATGGDAQPSQQADVLARQVAAHVVVEQLEVAELIGGDVAADLLQHRLARRLGQGGVVAGRAGLHHAARDQLAGA